MSKGLKIGLGIGAVLLVVLVLYFLLRKPATTWVAKKGGDISGTQYDIEHGTYTTLDDAKKQAESLGAKSFLVNGTNVIYKNANAPITTDPNGTYTLYVKQ